MEISRSICIARPRKQVFAYLADPRNDPHWCRKVISVEQVSGVEPTEGAAYKVVHRPIRFRPARTIDHTLVSWLPPERIEWREDDGTFLYLVTYVLDEIEGVSRLTQRTLAEVGAPNLFNPLFSAGIGRNMDRQLKMLKSVLESLSPDASRDRGG